MNQPEDRLRAAATGGPNAAPDLDTIVGRAQRLRRNRRIGFVMASVAIVAVGAAAGFSYLQSTSPTSIAAVGVGDSSDEADGQSADEANDTSSPDSAADGENGRDDNDDATPPAAGSTADTEPIDDGDDVASSEQADGDDVDDDNGDDDGSGSDDEAADGDDGGNDDGRPTSSSLGDGSGGWLTATTGTIRHQHADGTETTITFTDPVGGFAQRWPTDVVRLGNGYYLLIDQFVNRQDLASERMRTLAQRYGIPYDGDGDMYRALEGIASDQELSEVEHWEVGILAVDLASDQLLMVENRVINSANSPDWIYNGHITSDGANLVVMRELWQGYCHYVEGLSLNGQVVSVSQSLVYPKPRGLDEMTFDDITAVFEGRRQAPQPCLTLSDISDRGVAALGLQADPAEMEAFSQAFGEAGLG